MTKAPAVIVSGNPAVRNQLSSVMSDGAEVVGLTEAAGVEDGTEEAMIWNAGEKY